jgi:hypothetical protein
MNCKYYYIFFVTAISIAGCSTVKNGDAIYQPSQRNTFVHNTSLANNKSNKKIGPPEENLPAPDLSGNKIIEKGGRNIYIAPYWARLKPEKGIEINSATEMMQKAGALKAYAIRNGYNDSLGLLVNMKMKSGKRRFFVVNLYTREIITSGLVAHGRGNEKFTYNKQFSNEEGSNCTSPGMYKIGKSYNGAFGLSYKLYGLDKSNSNASKRYVVLHAMSCIPDNETPYPICQTEGCPAVSPDFLKEIGIYIDKSKQPLLLWIYN